MKRRYEIIVQGPPRPWTVYTKRGKPSQSFQNLQVYQAQIQAAIVNQVGKLELIEGPVKLIMTFLREANTRPSKAPPITRPDLTNYEKAAEDALTGLLFVDDSQVVEKHCSKGWCPDADGRTYIVVEEL